MTEQFKRRLSHSSMTMYMTCPRKYFYSKIQKVPVKQTQALATGSFMHSILEEVLDVKVRDAGINKNNYAEKLHEHSHELFKDVLTRPNVKFGKPEPSYEQQIKQAAVNEDEYNDILIECERQLDMYIDNSIKQIDAVMQYTDSIADAIKSISPKKSEMEIKTDNFIGYIDVVCEIGENEVVISDYKTSKLHKIRFKNSKYYDGISTMYDETYMVQLLTYAVMYYKLTGIKPVALTLKYLRTGTELVIPIGIMERMGFIDYDNALKEFEQLVSEVYELTESKDIADYPMNINSTFSVGNIHYQNTFCTCCEARFAGRGWCDFEELCNARLKDGDRNITRSVYNA